ncbi:lipopolysaccharide biosynthesis protein, partial [Vibrio anguillarum]
MNKSFSKNVLTLMTGTGIAQAIPIAIIPILTRMFSPEDFGLLALYAACVSILGVVATGRYEIAIMLPKDDEDARLLLQLSMLVALFFSLLISIPISIWNAQIARFLGNEDIAVWLYLVPVSVLFTG